MRRKIPLCRKHRRCSESELDAKIEKLTAELREEAHRALDDLFENATQLGLKPVALSLIGVSLNGKGEARQQVRNRVPESLRPLMVDAMRYVADAIEEGRGLGETVDYRAH